MSMPRKLPCTVNAITAHGGGVYTVDLQPENLIPAFHPGQFLHLTVDDYDPSGYWPESRVLSIASSPRDRSRLRICYSVKGRYTAKMEQTLAVGASVWVKLPYGEFVIDDARDAVLIAGGTGISAFTAFIEALGSRGQRSEVRDQRSEVRSQRTEDGDQRSEIGGVSPAPRVTLLYGARTPDLWLFRDMIERQVAACSCFNTLFFAESGLPSSDFCPPSSVPRPLPSDLCPLISGRCFLPGRISLDPLFPASIRRPLTSDLDPLISDRWSLTSDFCPLTSVFYLSGPPVMLASLKTDLKARGVPIEQIRTDAWE